jgi:hypothetical protein
MDLNVGSKTLNEVGGEGINSPTLKLVVVEPLCAWAHRTVRCANGRLQRLALTASRWTNTAPGSEQWLSGAHRTVRCDR